MARPEIEIEVEEATGRWHVDGLPMILVPRHFFLNNHFAVEAALGPERLAEILRPAGYRSAYHWCEREAAHHRLAGAAVFRHYMKRLSERGWGRFSVLALDEASGRARIRLDHSVFVDEERRRAGRRVCGIVAAWLEGSLDYATGTEGVRASETQCAAEAGHDHCLFEAAPGADR